MGQIKIGIFDELTVVAQGLGSLFNHVPDIQVEFIVNSKEKIIPYIKELRVHIFILNTYRKANEFITFIHQIRTGFPNVKVLVISDNGDQNDVLRMIKTGANGFLSKEANKNELIEAIYTIRNGYDFFSKSVTQLLLNNYMVDLKNSETPKQRNIKALSSREFEIMELWGGGLSNSEIAEKLFISIRTVESHKNHIMQKLNLKNSVDLVKFAIKNNIIEI